MKRIVIIFISINTAIFSIFLASKLCYAKDTIRRFALVAGANDGGTKRPKLHYAVSDADSIMKLLHEMGGVLPEDGLLLVEPDREIYLSGMNRIKDMVEKSRSKSGRLELIFYYSGHSDEEAILLGKEKLYYKEIRDYVTSMPVDVRIAILDSCSSGAVSRLKGGKRRKPFLDDISYNMKGYAFMTSSSLDEASQKSDRIRGSFFTHYLISGLRGAADMTQDGRITLSEAYQFAYNETLAGTEKSLHGPQHPHYNIQLSGIGDVVMTDIRKSSPIMIINENISGKLFIRDENNNLVCELRKLAGKRMQFGLEAGNYTIINFKDGSLSEANINLLSGKEILLSRNNFKKTEKEYTMNRGELDEKEQNGEFNGTLQKSFEVSSGGLLSLDSDRGSIELKGTDGNTVNIKVYRKEKAFVVEFDKRGNDIFVFGSFQCGIVKRILYHLIWSLMDVRYVIYVPRNYNVDLKTAGGKISVDDLKGEVRSITSGENLHFSNIKGPVTGKTSGGSIELTECTGKVNIQTSGGSVQIRNVDGNVNTLSTGGSITVKSINGSVIASTSGGRIEVQDVKGSVDVKTSGGSIDVQELMGSIDAVTSGGSITAHLLKQPDTKCRLATIGGKVLLSLADGIAVDIDAETTGAGG